MYSLYNIHLQNKVCGGSNYSTRFCYAWNFFHKVIVLILSIANYMKIKVENRWKMYVNGKRNTFAASLNCTNQSATSIDSSCHCDHKNQSQQNPHVTKEIHCLVNQLLLKWERKYFLCHSWNVTRTIIFYNM